jgi:fused signal recognition particle receptor
MLDDLEELLIASDVGVTTAGEILEKVRSAGGSLDAEGLRGAIKDEVVRILTARRPGAGGCAGAGALQEDVKPRVILVVGVNGTGKTTTIAKLAHLHVREGRGVLLAAADTYRAAAIEQLEVWAKRAGVQLVKHKPGADAASVAFDACSAAKSRGVDVVMVDTAGRLQTKKNLMDEVAKIVRVVGKVVEGAPHEVLLVLDATTGQNAISQARAFSETCGVTGIVIAKLDGTAKGGIVVAIAKEMSIPIEYVGVGEGIDDLEPFDVAAFAEALLG